MAKFSASEFKKELQKKADESAKLSKTTQQIANKAKETMYKVIKENIYDSYSPKDYKRRGRNGGLLDPYNIVAEVYENHIIIDNLAEPNDSIFGEEIVGNPQGLLYEWSDNGTIGTYKNMPWAFNAGGWREQRMGMTVKIIKDRELREFAKKTIIENME